jgi:hypothetical protein
MIFWVVMPCSSERDWPAEAGMPVASAGSLLGTLFDPEGEGDMLQWNIELHGGAI